MHDFVLCRPESGLNDILNQIERCCLYAQSRSRIVIVDTAYRNSAHFKDPFSKYFISRQSSLLLENPLPDEILDTLDVFPPFLAGRVSSYKPLIGFPHWIEAVSGAPLTFNFRQPYRETVVVHHQGGGGLKSVNCLKRLVLAPWLLERLEQRLSQLSHPYAALHIRNTDMTTDYRSVIAQLKAYRLPALFLATDNRNVLAEFRTALPHVAIHSFSSLPDIDGRPLHIDMPRQDAETRNADAILDLLTLALAQPLLISTTWIDGKRGYSGYSRLAVELNRNPDILRDLLNGSPVIPWASYLTPDTPIA